MNLAEILIIFEGSKGDATKALYDRLAKLGPAGDLAINLFRALKSSVRAKQYRGGISGKGSFKSMAYDRKGWAMVNLASAMTVHAEELGIRWGWAEDEVQEFYRWVLYIEIPTGQVSFHAAMRGVGPDFAGRWDGQLNASAGRICRWIAKLLEKEMVHG